MPHNALRLAARNLQGAEFTDFHLIGERWFYDKGQKFEMTERDRCRGGKPEGNVNSYNECSHTLMILGRHTGVLISNEESSNLCNFTFCHELSNPAIVRMYHPLPA